MKKTIPGIRKCVLTNGMQYTGLEEAIKAVYPDGEIQSCVVHQVRNSVKYVSYKDLKEVYKAPTQEAGFNNLMKMKEKWGKKYPLAIRSWENNWDRISTFFKYSPREFQQPIEEGNEDEEGLSE